MCKSSGIVNLTSKTSQGEKVDIGQDFQSCNGMNVILFF